MYKVCPACCRTSYSATAARIWLCPCCGEDISGAGGMSDSRHILSLAARRKSPQHVLSAAVLVPAVGSET